MGLMVVAAGGFGWPVWCTYSLFAGKRVVYGFVGGGGVGECGACVSFKLGESIVCYVLCGAVRAVQDCCARDPSVSLGVGWALLNVYADTSLACKSNL